MEKKEKSTVIDPFPEMIRSLPQIDIPHTGMTGWLLQGSGKQIVFFDIENIDEMPPHSHCAQWGMIVGGEMRFTIGGETKVYRQGDRYFIPEGVVHSAEFSGRVQVIDVFDDPGRYTVKK